jgi:hypothetical protein
VVRGWVRSLFISYTLLSTFNEHRGNFDERKTLLLFLHARFQQMLATRVGGCWLRTPLIRFLWCLQMISSKRAWSNNRVGCLTKRLMTLPFAGN